MSVSVHTTSTYKVEYGNNAVAGSNKTSEFMKFLRKKQQENYDGIFISEDEEDIEIDFSRLEKWKDDPVWGQAVKTILEESDKSNTYARLEIF